MLCMTSTKKKTYFTSGIVDYNLFYETMYCPKYTCMSRFCQLYLKSNTGIKSKLASGYFISIILKVYSFVMQ